MRNFERVLALQERFMGPQSGRTETEEWLFIRFYDFIPPHVRFNMLKLRRSMGTGWQQQHEQTLLYPWRYRELEPVLMSAGWSDLQSFGSLRGEPYEPDASSDLVITARRTGCQTLPNCFKKRAQRLCARMSLPRMLGFGSPVFASHLFRAAGIRA